MNDTDCSAVYEQLIDELQKFELYWVIAQVQQSINEDDTPKSRLILLINAIQKAIVDTFYISEEIHDFLNQEFNSSQKLERKIIFADPRNKDSDDTVVWVDYPDEYRLESEEQIQELNQYLERLLEGLRSGS